MTRGGRGRTSVRRPDGGLPDRLTELITPVTSAAGVDLEGLTVSRIGRRHLVRATVDSDQGVGLDQIADVSRAISAALDAAEESGAALVPGEYVLEVSSPGVDRPLTEPRHWRRNVGRLVSVTVAADGGDRHLTGRIVAATADQVTIQVDGETQELTYGQLGPGRVQVELNRGDTGAGPDDDLAGDDLADGDLAGGDLADGELLEEDMLDDPERIGWDGDEVGDEQA